MASKTAVTKLSATPRDTEGSRSVRRLRRSGRVPGVLYGGGKDAVTFDVDERELRHAMAASGAVIEVEIDGAANAAVVKDAQYDAVRGDTKHIDLLRVRLDVAIHAQVVIELVGGDDSPGVKEGGVLEQVVREINVAALPNDVPDTLELDVSAMVIGDTLTLSVLTAPSGVTLLDDPDETVLATLNPPKLSTETEDDLETETELIGEDGEPIEPAEGEEGEQAEGDDAKAAADGDSAGE